MYMRDGRVIQETKSCFEVEAFERLVKTGVDLTGIDLRNANLRSANLMGANLRSANLMNVDLVGANLGRCRPQGSQDWGPGSHA